MNHKALHCNYLICLFYLLFFSFTGYGQQTPTVFDPNIQITPFMEVKPLAVRVAKCTGDGHLYYIDFSGGIYRIDEIVGQSPTDTLIATAADHGINYLQGLAIGDSSMYLCGNYKMNGQSGYGLVSRGQLQPDGTWIFSNLMTTVPYESSAVLFDHAFSGICLTPAKDSIIICSGARTDHGEIQTANGLFPGKRDVALTSAIFKLPANGNGIILQNDSAWLDASGYMYARGVRNAFDVAYDKNSNLFGVENSGDRDDPEELNWLQNGHHYGFPWVMGGNNTGQQFPSYDPLMDSLINHNSLAWLTNCFYNDPAYPQMPPGLVVTPGVKNLGPDADMWHDPDFGNIVDVSDTIGITIRTFTAHKAPLGLVFDVNENLGDIYTGDGFVLGYTRGCADSSGYIPGYGLGPVLETGEDLLHLKLEYDSTDANYNAHVTRIAAGFINPVDAEMVDNVMYVMENGFPGGANIPMMWKLIFPPNTTHLNTVKDFTSFNVFPNPSSEKFHIAGCHLNDVITVYDISGKQKLEQVVQSSDHVELVNVSSLSAGFYILNVQRNGVNVFQKKLIYLGM